MIKYLKLSAKIISVSILLIFIILGAGLWYLDNNLLSFEGKKINEELKELKIDEYSFIDRNGNGKLDPYEDSRNKIEDRVEDLMNKMILEEKIHLLKGSGMGSAFGSNPKGVPGAAGTIVPTPRLGLPEVYFADGPAGLRLISKREGVDKRYYNTAFPIGSLLASTWNTELVKNVGVSIGSEAKSYGVDLVLGPGVNLHRHPLCGRNFEYYSEDPFLTGHIGAAMINGIESEGIGASPKHFAVNNQETSRNWNDAIVSERALRELYLKSFKIIVKESQPWAIMTSYNKINGTYAAENKRLLTDILRNKWGFKGLVMTDWYGGRNSTNIIKSGNDLIEPGTKNDWENLKKSALDGSLPLLNIDESVKRILTLVLKSQKMKNHNFDNNPKLKEHALVTRKAGSEGIILLKNSNTLPLKNINNIALFGSTSYEFISGGTGSGDVAEAYTISLDEALEKNGFRINEIAEQEYIRQNLKSPKKNEQSGGASLTDIINFLKTMINPPKPLDINYSPELIKKISETSDIAIVTIGRNSGETADRKIKDDFLLSKSETEMIKNICEIYHSKGKKVIVVLNIGGVIETRSWNSLPDAILLAWQGGQEGGNSVTDIITGKINPSGKLPMTFPNDINDHKSSLNFPMDGAEISLKDILYGIQKKDKPENEKIKNKDFTVYEEGIYVGYRHFDKEKLDVSYPFGYGLSYTKFKLNDLNLTKENNIINVEIKISNIGNMPGKEVVQLYSSKSDSNVDRPIKELKAFKKTPLLKPGESIRVKMKIPTSELSYWSEVEDQWILEKGFYTFFIGNSSRELPLKVDFEIK